LCSPRAMAQRLAYTCPSEGVRLSNRQGPCLRHGIGVSLVTLASIHGGHHMRARVASTAVLFFLLAAVGAPVGVYGCPVCTEAGAASHSTSSPGPCCACCNSEGRTELRGYCIRGEMGCCGPRDRTALSNGGMLVPDPRNEPVTAVADEPAPFAAARPAVCVASTPHTVSTFRPSVNPPLRI
jgi:hypothetical protein